MCVRKREKRRVKRKRRIKQFKITGKILKRWEWERQRERKREKEREKERERERERGGWNETSEKARESESAREIEYEGLVGWLVGFEAWHINPYHHHDHHVVLQPRISLTVSRYFSLSFIASGWSSGAHPVSSHSCLMFGRSGRPAFARPYVGVHSSTSLMSTSLLLQQCPACLYSIPNPVMLVNE